MKIHVHLKLYGYHGCNPQEAIHGQWFHFDVYVHSNGAKAVYSDQLSDSVDYVRIYNIIKEENAQRSNLIEHLAGRIKKKLHDAIVLSDKIEVKVSKPNPGGLDENLVVSVEL
jgi:dihydroneopterin aldolase